MFSWCEGFGAEGRQAKGERNLAEVCVIQGVACVWAKGTSV